MLRYRVPQGDVRWPLLNLLPTMPRVVRDPDSQDETMSNDTDRSRDMMALRAALVAGEESGEPEEFDFDAFIAAKKKA